MLSRLPSATSSLIASQPSSVPGAILTAEELLDPIKNQKDKNNKLVQRVQPAGLKYRIKVAGQGAVGGRGEFQGEGVTLEKKWEMNLEREDVQVGQGGVQEANEGNGDVQMADVQLGTNGQAEGQESPKKKKKEKSPKKEGSPKKKDKEGKVKKVKKEVAAE